MTQHDRNLSHLIKQTKFCNFGMLKNLPYVVIPAHNAEIQIYRNGLNEKLLDKPRQPPYYDSKGIYDSKLVFDLQLNDKIQ